MWVKQLQTVTMFPKPQTVPSLCRESNGHVLSNSLVQQLLLLTVTLSLCPGRMVKDTVRSHLLCFLPADSL